MERINAGKCNGPVCFVIFPGSCGKLLVYGPVVNLPVFHGFGLIVKCKLLLEIVLQKFDRKGVSLCNHRGSDKESLLELVLIFFGPFVVVSDYADGGIDSVSRIQDIV